LHARRNSANPATLSEIVAHAATKQNIAAMPSSVLFVQRKMSRVCFASVFDTSNEQVFHTTTNEGFPWIHQSHGNVFFFLYYF
jgi:hypothetical protein